MSVPTLYVTDSYRSLIACFCLPYISFIIAFTALEWIPYMESLYSQSGLPSDPHLWVKLRS